MACAPLVCADSSPHQHLVLCTRTIPIALECNVDLAHHDKATNSPADPSTSSLEVDSGHEHGSKLSTVTEQPAQHSSKQGHHKWTLVYTSHQCSTMFKVHSKAVVILPGSRAAGPRACGMWGAGVSASGHQASDRTATAGIKKTIQVSQSDCQPR